MLVTDYGDSYLFTLVDMWKGDMALQETSILGLVFYVIGMGTGGITGAMVPPKIMLALNFSTVTSRNSYCLLTVTVATSLTVPAPWWPGLA